MAKPKTTPKDSGLTINKLPPWKVATIGGQMYTYIFNIVAVIDGDTIDGHIDLGLNVSVFKRIRLFGINAPETRTKDLLEKEAGLVTKKWLRDKLMEAFESRKTIIIKTEKDDSGKYGRLLGTLFINGVNINHEMLMEGLAVPYE